MNADRARRFMLSLPHVCETLQWGETLVFWVAAKTAGGKMFALIPLDATAGAHRSHVASFSAGPQGFAELLECEAFVPAPYLARARWIAAERWDALSDADWQRRFKKAHHITWSRLAARTRAAFPLTQSPE